jgi:hypothetical protein
MHLPIGDFHAELMAVDLTHPTQRAMLEPPGGILPCLPLMFPPVALEVMANHGQDKARLSLGRMAQGPAVWRTLGEWSNSARLAAPGYTETYTWDSPSERANSFFRHRRIRMFFKSYLLIWVIFNY